MPNDLAFPEEQAAVPRADILLVDDDPANLLALEAILDDLGHNLVKATSGEEALRLLSDRDFAVVLLDVRMPGLDGFETARLIRSRERSRHTPIIFLTAHDDNGPTTEEAYSLGAVDYLVKPLRPSILRAKVAGFVELFQEKEQARRQADQLRLLVQGTADYAIFMLDPQGRVATWNAGAERIKGYKAEEIVGQHFSVFYPQEAVERGWPDEELRRAATEGRFEDEGWRFRKDGSRFWANVVITALRDEAGRLRGFSKITRDLTERRQKEEELRQLHRDLERRVEERTAALAASNEALQESEARKAAILDAALDCIITIDHQGKIIDFNPAAERTLGYRRDDVIGRELAELIMPPAMRDHHRQGLARYLATGEGPVLNRRIEMTALRADGTEFPVELAITPIPTEGPATFTGFVRDITERKRLEGQLRQRAEELAEANRLKDQFVMMLAHELRNPLAPILNGLHVLRLSEADRQAVDKARSMMERQVQHLSRIVDDLLQVSRVTQGTLAIRPERLDLARLVRVTAEDHRPVFEQAGVALELELPELPVWVQGDPTRLAQIFGNLLQNAVKFTDRGGKVVVNVGTDEARQQAVLTVRDTGAGIEPDILPRLFQSFAQADRSLDRSKGGLGLGLALVKGLVELHGGEAHAASEGPGRGAEFTVRLPRQPEPPALAAMPAVPGRARKNLRILVVEDNRDSADSLKMLLELFGYDVAVAYTGPAGVKTAEDWHPDVVLCDIGLPGMSGFEVAGALRRNPATAKARMIAVTGYGSDEDRRRSEAAGFDAHLTKPADPAAIQELLARSG